MDPWIAQQVESLRGLRGKTVTGWFGIEMALRDVGPDGLPQWYDKSVPALQLNRLDMVLLDGTIASLLTYQNDTLWGLCLRDGLPPSQLASDSPESIFRAREFGALPTGEVADVDVIVDKQGDIA